MGTARAVLAADTMGDVKAEGEAITRESYKTAGGKSASMYRTHVWKGWPVFKNGLTLIACSTTIFVTGPALITAALWACPRTASVVGACGYLAHLFLSRALHTGSMESYWWRAQHFHLAVMEYFGYRLLIEDDVKLRPDRKYVIGTHPHGVYALGQMPFMFTSRHNPLYQLFPFLKNKVQNTGASVVFYIPLLREMFLLAGHVVVSKGTLKHWLKKGHSVGIVVGGEVRLRQDARHCNAHQCGLMHRNPKPFRLNPKPFTCIDLAEQSNITKHWASVMHRCLTSMHIKDVGFRV
jgi:hypothetical protein